MYGCECWTIKKVEHWLMLFERWYWRRLLRVPWTARRFNRSILKAISPEYSLEGLMLKLKLQYFGHLMCRADSLEKTLILGKMRAGGEGDDIGWDDWMLSLTQWTWVWANFGRWWSTEKPGVLQSMGLQRVRHNWVTEQFTVSASSPYIHSSYIWLLHIHSPQTDVFKVISNLCVCLFTF